MRLLYSLILGGASLSGIGWGVFAMLSYELTPAELAQAPSKWPEDSSLILASDRSTLLMFLHPACPCSRASLDELSDVARQWQNEVAIRLVFLATSDAQLQTSSGLCKAAQSMPGVQLLEDDGHETARFGASASGEILLYDAQGDLKYHGGITGARGHRGDNFAKAALVQALSDKKPPSREMPVFGCPLCKRPSSSTQSCSTPGEIEP
jgi:hypothetical protein